MMYNDSFRVRYGSAPVAISENAEHYDTAPHIHAEIEMLYIKRGRAQIFVSDRSYTVSEGEVVIVNPMEVHSVIADKTLPYHQMCICFDLSLLPDKSMADELTRGGSYINGFLKNDEQLTGPVKEYFERMFYSVLHSSDALLFESTAYASLIFAELKKYGYIISKRSGGKKSGFASKVQAYLSEHFSENITSEHAARGLFYTQSYFCRLFRENFGVPFLEYLSMYRISKAKTLLSDTSLKISDIAESVGFLDQSYFSRCFKHFIGVSPSEYKKHQYSNIKKSI